MAKRYYWLKLKEDFFDSKQIKKLRRMAGGDTYTIIYLKMQLTCLKTGGVIEYTGLENDFVEELALDIDENPDDVRMTLAFLSGCKLIETSDGINYFLPQVLESTGSEADSAQRVRDYRERQKALLGNSDVTNCNTEKEKEKEKETREEKRHREDVRQREFDAFWKAYPRKTAKQDAIKAFAKLQEKEYPLLIPAIERQKQTEDWKKQNGKFIPYPATWLNGRRWEDELPNDEGFYDSDTIPEGYVIDKYGELMKMPIGRLLTPEECERLGRDY